MLLGVHCANLTWPGGPTGERFERLEETLQIVKQGWADGGSYDGKHYRLAELTVVPQPLRPGGPRIVVGGMGERKTLRLVAEYADLGISQVWVGPDAADPVGWTEQMCERVLPRLSQIG